MKRLTAIATLCVLPAALGAQVIRGTVVRPGSDIGIAGVVVLLVDSTGRVVARSLTDERGAYRVAGDAPGSYRIRTMRIGFRPASSEVIPLVAGQELTYRVSLASVPFVLDAMRVVGVNACRVRTDTAAATYAIWEQVRTALTATQISTGDRTLGATVVTYDRTLAADGRSVRSQQSQLNRSFGAQPWRAQSVAELRRLGYVVDDAQGGKTYYAPDLDVLLSDAFLDDHCFRISRDRDAGRIGLEFEPASNRRELPDIRGTIWLNRNTSELDRLEFRYANVTRAQEDGRAGGEMAFVRMANGAWAISRWSIRMPVLERYQAGGFNGAAHSNEVRVSEIRIGGGELAVMTRARDTIWARAPLVLSGLIADSSTGRAVRDARVSLRGTAQNGVTDSEGRFSISGVLPGEYAIEVRTASLDAVGAVHQSALTFTDGLAPLTIRVPVAQQVAATLCGPRRESQDGIVLGTVSLRGDTIPPANVRVIATWTEIGYDVAPTGSRPNRSVEARTDGTGRFRLCGVPLRKALVVSVVSDSLAAEPVPVQVADGLLGRVDIVVDRMAVTGAVFTGMVLMDSTRQPIAGAEVTLPELSLTVQTNERGAFRFLSVPPGSHAVVAPRVGYGPLTARVLFTNNEPVNRQIFLSRVVVLDSVNTVAQRTRLGVGLAAFEERRRMGFGKFIDSEMLRKNEHRRLPDVMRDLGGISIYTPPKCLRCENPPGNMQIAYNPRTRCYFRVFLDGVVVGKGVDGPPVWRGQLDLNGELLSSIEAVEVYRGYSEVPLAYGGANSQCGIVLLWTRQPY